MARLEVKLAGFAEAMKKLNGAGERVFSRIAESANTVGERAQRWIQEEYRSGPRSDTRTQVRNNKLRPAYGHKVTKRARSVDLDVGGVKPGTDASVLRYLRTQEGYRADGSRFSSLTIRPKRGKYLTFPVYRGDMPGTSQAALIGWRRAKSVTFTPRPSLPGVNKKFAPELQQRIEKHLGEVLS